MNENETGRYNKVVNTLQKIIGKELTNKEIQTVENIIKNCATIRKATQSGKENLILMKKLLSSVL